MDELLSDFLAESGEQLDAIAGQLARFERDPRDIRIVANIFLLIHAIKGACGFLDLPRLERLARAAEALVARLRDGVSPSAGAVAAIVTTVARIKAILADVARSGNEPPGDDDGLIAELARSAAPPRPAAGPWLDGAFVPGPAPPERRLEGARVSAAAIERMTSLAAELASIRDRVVEIAGEDANPALGAAAERLSAVSADLRATVAAARMSPADRLFALPRRVARDTAAELDKKIEIRFEGGDVELDRGLIEILRDSLAELARNAVVHGVESPEARRRRGKPETGVVTVAIRADGDAAAIEVADDGGGMDFAAIRERAFALGLGSRWALAALSPTELALVSSAPGSSEAGAGLARVRAHLEAAGGSIAISSRRGRGALARLRIAARRATTPVFVLEVGDARFALPRRRVEAILELGPEDADDPESILTPDGRAPAVPFASRLGCEGASRDHRVALKVRHGATPFWIVADRARRVADIALGPLPSPLRGLRAFSSAGVLPDGSVVLALDPAGLALAESAASPCRGATDIIVFRSGGATPRALPAAAVSEIAAIRAREIEVTDGARFARLGDRRVPLIGAERGLRDEASPSPLLVLWRGADSVGLLVDEIVDFGRESVAFDFRRAGPGRLGVARAGEVDIEILDPIGLADPGFVATGDGREAALVLDRDPFFQGAITQALRRDGYEARATGEAGEALAVIAAERRFAVAFVDLDIADAREGEFARRCGEDGFGPPPRLIGLAAHGGPAIQARARRAGLSSAIGRFDRAAMLAVLRDALPTREIAA